MTDYTATVEKVIEAAGGATSLARQLDIKSPSVVANWRTRGRVPVERVLDVERVTGVSRHEMRPDIFGPPPASEAAE